MGYDIEKEKREAIEAGRRALNSLQTAKENLNSAKNWGLADMFGGGYFTTMLKHSKMDQAKQNMEQAKYDFRNFSKELDDVNMACNLNIDTGDFLSFAFTPNTNGVDAAFVTTPTTANTNGRQAKVFSTI